MLRTHEYFYQRSPLEIVNSDLFNLSPVSTLNHKQVIAVEDRLFADFGEGAGSIVVVQGNPGIGKTVVAVYLLKLLDDMRWIDSEEPVIRGRE